MPERKRRKTRQASPDVLDVHEAGWLLGAHIETVRRLARRGGVPAYKMGKDWRFSKQALTRWMERPITRDMERYGADRMGAGRTSVERGRVVCVGQVGRV